jgi:hypothetical protein
MRNPLRDEGSAFHLVLGTLAAAAAVALASWADVRLGVGVLAAVLALALVALRGAASVTEAPRAGLGDGVNRVLVIANETVRDGELLAVVRERVGASGRALVVAPALNTRLRTWTSDEDGARAEARRRLTQSIALLRDSGVDVSGMVGDGSPVQAAEDALHLFPADEIVVSTHPPGRSNWLESGVVEAIERRLGLPVTHVVVDAEPVSPSGHRRSRRRSLSLH